MLGALKLPDIPTSRSLVVRDSDMLPASPMGSSTGVSAISTMSPMESMKEVFLEIRDNTAETVELLKTAVLGPPGEARDESITEAETDESKDKSGMFSLKGVGSALDKVNPFSSNFAFGNFGRALLAGGGLLLLKTFGDNLIDPLANLLRTIKESKLGELIKGGATDAFTALKDTFTMVVEGTIKFVEFIKATYKTIEDFLMSYDDPEKGGDASGTLDGDEIQNMITDVKDQIVESIVEFTGAIVKGVALAIIGVPLTGFAVRAITSQITPLFAGPGKAVQGPVQPGKTIKGVSRFAKGPLSLASRIALPLLVLSGLLSTYDNVTQSAAEAIDAQGKIDTSEFVAKFFGGKKDGGIANAFDKALSIGGTASVVGAGLGMILGPGGALVGAMVGGMVGLALGAVVGGVSGYLGSDRLKQAGSFITETAASLGNSLYAEFEALAAGVAAAFKGEDISDAYNMSKSQNKKEMNFQIERANKRVENAQEKYDNYLNNFIGPDKEFVAFDPTKGLFTRNDGEQFTNYGHPLMFLYNDLNKELANLDYQRQVAGMSKRFGTEAVDLEQGFLTDSHTEAMERTGEGPDFTYATAPGGISGQSLDFKPQFDRNTLTPISDSMGSSRQPGIAIANNSTNDSYNQQTTNVLDGLALTDISSARLLGLEKDFAKARG